MEAVFTILEAIEHLVSEAPFGLGIIGFALGAFLLVSMVWRLVMLSAKIVVASAAVYLIAQMGSPALSAFSELNENYKLEEILDSARSEAVSLASTIQNVDIAVSLQPSFEARAFGSRDSD